MNKNKTYTATNFREIRDYISSFAKGNEVLEHYLCLALTDMLANRQSCIRAQTQDDIKEPDDKLWNSLSSGLLGEKYIFDPALEKGLDDKVSATAQFLEAALTMHAQWGKSSPKNKIEPFMIKPEFLRVATSMIDSSHNTLASDARLTETLDRLNHSISKITTEEESAEISDSTPAKPKRTTPTDTLFDFEDGWKSIPGPPENQGAVPGRY